VKPRQFCFKLYPTGHSYTWTSGFDRPFVACGCPQMSRLERLYSPPEIGAPGKREAHRRRRDLLYSGLFVLAMAGIAIAAMAVLMPGLLSGAYRLHAYFSEATGLTDGIQVIQIGSVIGIVEEVTPLFPGHDPDATLCPAPAANAPARSPALPCFHATLRIKGEWPVPSDSQAQLGAAGVLQGDAVMIRPGSEPTLLADDDRISTLEREPDLATRVSALTESVKGLIQETITPTMESVRKIITGLETSLDTEKITAILDSTETLTRNLKEVSARLGGSTDDIKGTVRQYGDLAREVQGLVTDSRPTLRRTLDGAQVLMQQLNADLTPILINVEDASRNLSALSRDLRQDPASIIKGRRPVEQPAWFK
jgi:phospholipid/cholesterol/gamma-HCH transport system substrate-binding protein